MALPGMIWCDYLRRYVVVSFSGKKWFHFLGSYGVHFCKDLVSSSEKICEVIEKIYCHFSGLKWSHFFAKI